MLLCLTADIYLTLAGKAFSFSICSIAVSSPFHSPATGWLPNKYWWIITLWERNIVVFSFFLNVFYLFIYDLESQRLCKKKVRQEINLPRCHVCKPPVMGELGVHPAPLQAHFAFREWNFSTCQSGGCHSHLKTGPASSSSRPVWAPTHLSEHLGFMEWSPLAWESTWTLAEFPSLGGSCQTCSHVEKGSSLLLALTLGVSSATFSCKGISNISGEIFTFHGSSKSRIALSQPQ